MRRNFLFLLGLMGSLAALSVLTGCGGKSKAGAAVSIVVSDMTIGYQIPDLILYMSLIDDKGNVVLNGVATTDEKGCALFEGLPPTGHYTIRMWTVDEYQCEVKVDLSQFTGANRGKHGGDCLK